MKLHLKHPYLLPFIGIVLFICLLTIKHIDLYNSKISETENEEIKDPNKLYPQELFFLDRNYPDYAIEKNLFQQRLSQSIQFDEKNITYRDLDHPWKIQGPGNIGGRINTIEVHPQNSQIILLGYSQGGIYQTSDGGINWRPVFDDQSSLSISHISFDSEDANVVYATTGDVNISGYPFIGSGLYRSMDFGITWSLLGLPDKGVLSKVVVDPNDNQIIYVGSMGYPSHKGDERGLFRSTDGGQSWIKSLTIDDSTGVIDLVVDPVHPGRVYASGWTRIRNSKYGTTVGPGTSFYRSDDYGATWENHVNGLPGEYHSRTGLEIASDGTLFISYIGTVNAGECAGYTESLKGIFRSTNGGMTWDTVQAFPINGLYCELFGSFGWYFEVLKVNPENPLDMFLLGVDLYRTIDGGETWFEAAPPWWTYDVHADKHDLAFGAGTIYLATDGGAYSQPVEGLTPWVDLENISSTQFYRTAYNPHAPDQYFGGAQDNGTTGGNENIFNAWPRIFGGDGFQPLFDPTEPTWIYALTQNGYVWFSPDSGANYIDLTNGFFGTRYWDMPIVMSPHDSKTLYAASNVVFKINMLDSIPMWIPISPDLTKAEIILGNRYPAITSLAQSELDEMRLYAGTQDGKLWTSPNGGTNWIDISEGTPDQYVTSISTSTIDPLTVFVTYSGYRDNDHTPYIYKSENAGEEWTSLGTNIPMLGVNSFLILPGWNDDILFVATDGGVYVSQDEGIVWKRLGSNFPYMPVYDLEYNPVMNEIVAATFSRGLMTFPVEELDLVSGVDGMPINNLFDQITFYPTIVQDWITLDFGGFDSEFERINISIVDIAGRVIQLGGINTEGIIRVNPETNEYIVQGIYFLQVSNGAGSAILGSFVKL